MQLSSTVCMLVDAAADTAGADRLSAELGARLVAGGLPVIRSTVRSCATTTTTSLSPCTRGYVGSGHGRDFGDVDVDLSPQGS